MLATYPILVGSDGCIPQVFVWICHQDKGLMPIAHLLLNDL
jgi:hypothetical protein